jgi:Protein of unknown function (DUF3311)
LRQGTSYTFKTDGGFPPGREERMAELAQRDPRDWSWWYLLLLIPFVAVLWVPFYNFAEPYLVLGRQPPPANYVRLTTHTANNETGPFKVWLPLTKSGANYRRWIEVWLDGKLLRPGRDWTLSSPSGPLDKAPRPITDAEITFTSPRTGEIQIVADRPGIPFFYWYQLLWVLIGAALTAFVYFMTERRPAAARK